ncbi:hypothetical protein TETLIM4_000125 [Candidatus Hodgkinia cicadicola]|nr:hypothetical protein TETLIM4_000125 [Candidatus Hodgkinia cicadicola]
MPPTRNGRSITNSSALACHFVQSCSKRVWISLRKLCASRSFWKLICVSDSNAVYRAVTTALLKHCRPTAILKRLAKLVRLEVNESVRQFKLKKHTASKLTWTGLRY